jgi:energy-coupling factor transport system ATP-binding protein
MLGPAYAVGIAAATAIIRNLLGIGTLLAFPGGSSVPCWRLAVPRIQERLCGRAWRGHRYRARGFAGQCVDRGSAPHGQANGSGGAYARLQPQHISRHCNCHHCPSMACERLVSGNRDRLSDISYRYPGTTDGWSLARINLTIRDGEFVLICGASGSGKSTLAYLFNGLIPHFFGGDLQGSREGGRRGHKADERCRPSAQGGTGSAEHGRPPVLQHCGKRDRFRT